MFAFEKNKSFNVAEGDEYNLSISFSLRGNNIVKRDINTKIKVSGIYADEEGNKIACDCTYTEIKEEDIRFLYEKATSLLFI